MSLALLNKTCILQFNINIWCECSNDCSELVMWDFVMNIASDKIIKWRCVQQCQVQGTVFTRDSYCGTRTRASQLGNHNLCSFFLHLQNNMFVFPSPSIHILSLNLNQKWGLQILNEIPWIISMEIYIFLPQDVSDVRVAFHFPINMRGVSVCVWRWKNILDQRL